ncbi:MAG: hypothetical protein C4348_01725 [Patescibacteria group bacterium]
MKIVPAINAQTFEEVKEKINILKDLIKHFHLDLTEKKYTGYQTWNNLEDLNRISESFEFDLHLMKEVLPQAVVKFNKKNIKRLIFHLEFCSYPDALIKQARKIKKEIYLALSPNLEIDFILKYLKFIDGVLILGVNPGKAGQKFIKETLEKIKLVKEKLGKKQKLMIDGGINKENIDEIIKLRPDFIIMASAIYNNNAKENYLYFLHKIK